MGQAGSLEITFWTDTSDFLTHLVYFTVELVVDASQSQNITAYLGSLTAAPSSAPMSLPNHAGFIQQKRVPQWADMARYGGVSVLEAHPARADVVCTPAAQH